MKFYKLTATLVLAAAVAATAALAQTGSEGVFTIHNSTESNVVVGFYTNDGTGWSANWLSERLSPGTQAEAQFASDSGNCDQTLQVGWLGEDNTEVKDEPISIDICEATHVYLDDNEIYFD
ncbi:hypothetical protein PZ897_16830 [Hoeflea sp. YIM 152468]|uniref:hypothetical protein n=1 Tax=Hoeflea sp. YIM 152468 TaxID=3031759 RepID=UPI0023DCA022|nr:hypothetical protein [Hoeflea sp. YIM 152468]MDF1609853.1 hypothetical protein [Hoeflea sp. YIM 152468]